MAVLSTKFKLVDDMSDKLKNLGTNGKDVEKQLQDIGTSASSLDKISDSAEKSTQAITESSEAIQQYNEWHEKSVDALTDYINGVEGSEEDLNKYIGTSESASETTEKFNEKLKGAQKEHQKTQEETEKTSEKTKEYGDKNKETFETLENLVAAAGIVTFLKQVYDGYTKCIEAASEYETSIAKVSTLADPNVMSLGQMSDDILDLSSKTGQAASALAEAEYEALSAGVATENAAGFVETATKLAVGGFTESATAVDVLTTALNAYQLNASETTHIADTLIMTQDLGKTTVDELANSMGRVIPSAAAYNVQIEDLSTAYALLTANGIATSEATTYLKGIFNELGSSSSDVSTVLQEETGKTFAMLIEDGSSLGDVIGILSDSVDGNATAFANLWSSQEAGIGALSLLTSGTEKYNSTLESMENSTGKAEHAYRTMSETSEYTAQAVQTAGTNFQIAVGNAMLPATNKFNEAITSVLNGLTTFVNDHPGVVKALAAGTAGLAAATVAITLYSARSQIATVATLALKAAQTALSGPVGIVITLITAAATALAAWALSQDDAAERANELTTASQKQKDALDEATAKYEEAAEKYGENSFITQEYKANVDELTTSFNDNKKTLGDLISTNEELSAKYEEIQSNDKTEEINNEADATKSLSDRLFELAGRTNLTKSENAEMLGIIEQLNNAFPELGLNYDNVINKATQTKEALLDVVNQEYDNQKYENAKQSYMDSLALLEQEEEYFNSLNEQMQDPYEKYINSDGNAQAQAEWDSFWNSMIKTTDENGNEIEKTFGDVYEESSQRLEDLQTDVDNYADAMAEAKGITEEAADSQVTWEDAAQTAFDSVETEVSELVTAYQEAYDSALTSFEGQYALWDEVDDISATSASTLMSNLDSQISYWQNYADNLESLQGRNIEGLDKLLASIDDGSEESAAALAGMASASDTELQKMVDKYGTLQSEQDRTAQNSAELETEFGSKMDGISSKMESTIDSMNLSTEASTAAKNTIDAYVNAIKAGVSDAENAASLVAQAASNALSSGGTTSGSSGSVPKHARGTTSAEDIFIAGEEGPELIVGHEGATVYTADETKQILNQSLNIPDSSLNSSVGTSSDTEPSVSSGESSEKIITLRLEGIGTIQLSGSDGVSKTEIVDILAENIKPVLIGVINEEIYEEGDESYEF